MIYPQKTYIGIDTVLYEPHSTDATKIVLKAGGQFSLPDGTLIRLQSDKTLDINDDLTTDDTLTADTWYHIWCNATVCKFSDSVTAPSDVSNGAMLRGGVYVTNREHIHPFGMRRNGELYFTQHRLRVPWTDTGSTLPGNLGNSQVAIIGDYVYLFGGSSSAYTNVIYRAPLSDPTSWTNTGSTLPGNLGRNQVAIIGDYVYLFGGYNGSAYTNVIYRAPLNTYRMPIYDDTDIFSWILGRAISSHEIQGNKPWRLAP